MVPRRDVTSVGRRAGVGTATEAADLTGPTPGLAVEISAGQPATVVLGPSDWPRRTRSADAYSATAGSCGSSRAMRAEPDPCVQRSPHGPARPPSTLSSRVPDGARPHSVAASRLG